MLRRTKKARVERNKKKTAKCREGKKLVRKAEAHPNL